MLSENQVGFYQEHGYLLLPDILDRQYLAQLTTVIDEFVAGAEGLTHENESYDLEDDHRPECPRDFSMLVEPPRQPRQQTEPAVRCRQQRRPAVRRDITTGEIRLDPTPATAWKIDLRKGTIRHRRSFACETV